MSLAIEGPTRPHPRVARPRESWWGTLAVAASLLIFAGLVCAAAALSLADRIPRPLDRYLPSRPGQTSLYRAQYANGSQGFATINVVKPGTDAATYVAVYASGQPLEVHTSYTNWQGTGANHDVEDYYAHTTDRLSLIAEQEAGVTSLFTPPLLDWSPAMLTASATAPVTGVTNFNGVDLNYQVWRVPDETVTLPGGARQSALRVESDLRRGATLLFHSSGWYVAGLGQVRLVTTDAQGHPLTQLDLLTSTELPASQAAAVRLPLADLQVGGGAAAANAFFRENAARTGAWPAAALDAAQLRVTYRLQTRIPFSASPAFANGLFYAADQNGQLAALDAYQGSPRWRFSAGGPMVAAPAIAGGIVYAAAGDKTLYALDAAHGMYLWSYHFKDALDASPVAANGLVYAASEDRTLVALDAQTGQPRWKFTAGDRFVSSPAVANGRLIVGCDDSVVYALDAATGKLLWRYALDAPVEATPLIDPAGNVYAASNGTQLAAINGATGAQIWNTATRFGYLASPALAGRLIVDGDQGGTFRAYNAQTGAIVWEQHEPAAQEFVSSPLVLGNEVLAADTSGNVYVWDSASGKLLRQLALGSAVTGSPTWTGEAVLLTDEAGELLALQSAPGVRGLTLSPAWQHSFENSAGDPFPASPYAQPLLSGSALITVLRGGGLWQLDPQTGAATHLGEVGDNVFGNLARAGDTLVAGTQHGRVAAYKIGQAAPLWQTTLSSSIIRFGPAIGGQMVFVSSFTNTASIVSGLDLATGKLVWSQQYRNGSATPVFDQGRLYVAADAILALDPDTGATLWRSAPFNALGSLAVYDGVVYAGSNAGQGVTFVALDEATGQPLWQSSPAVRFAFSRPAYDAASHIVLAGAENGQLFAFDARGGQLRWTFQTDGPLESDPQVQAGMVYLTSQNGDTYAIDIATGRLLTNVLLGTPVYTYAPPLVAPGYVYVTHGVILYGLAAANP